MRSSRGGVIIGRFRCVFFDPVVKNLGGAILMKPSAWPLLFLLWFGFVRSGAAAPAAADTGKPTFPKPLEEYHDEQIPGVFNKLAHRMQADPFNPVGSLIFLAAIIHTFLAARFMQVAHRLEYQLHALEKEGATPDERAYRERDRLRFRAQLFHFLGEVEAVFGIWLIPLALVIVAMKGWKTLTGYAAASDPAEAVFVVVVMAIASSRPVLRFAEAALAKVAALAGSTPAAWWLTILTVGPLLGSFITEPAAMTICALLLRQKFYDLQPGPPLRYATLALLFVNISVGGTLSHFAAPPIVMVANRSSWDLPYMLANYGWKAVLGIVVANGCSYLRFRNELAGLGPKPETAGRKERRVPKRIAVVNLLFIAWVVLAAHYPLLVVIGFLFFLAFVEATRSHQVTPPLRGPLLVGFFLLALILHGRCQQWWIEPVLRSLSEWPLMIGATLLTALNDNAAITYLASLVPGFSNHLKYAVVAGAVAGGGLTVIANAPNPAGQSILVSRFGDEGISALRLFLWALFPTIIMGAAFMLLR